MATLNKYFVDEWYFLLMKKFKSKSISTLYQNRNTGSNYPFNEIKAKNLIIFCYFGALTLVRKWGEKHSNIQYCTQVNAVELRNDEREATEQFRLHWPGLGTLCITLHSLTKP